jgi:mannose-1-phosphate guanylyltransferase
MFLPLIMAGGTGTRLWPLSRRLNPKQFLRLMGELSMLEATLARLDGLKHSDPVLICNEEHRFIAAEQLRRSGVKSASILLEPAGRNTAPAIAVAALYAVAHGDDPILLVLAADHLITDTSAFHDAVLQALPLAEAGQLVTFGIAPTAAETGYGYIQRGEPLGEQGFGVARFVEKPSADTAQAYLDGGDYYWNSGMFMFRASRYLEELERHQPEMIEACRASVEQGQKDLDFVRLAREPFLACPADSIDYAVMEKTEYAAMVPMDAGWSDVGSWSSLWEVSAKDDDNNVLRGDVMSRRTRNTLVHAEHRLVTTLGVENLVIVETKDAVLVARKDFVQEVKQLVEDLEAEGRCEHLNHREVYRPWGCYDLIDYGERFQVKRITVNPGARLSVQMHHHRAEHWVVVSGTAKVTHGERTYIVSENDSTFIPVGHVHALENPGKIPLHLIEVQSGSYLGEDDIVRLDDHYGRD